MLHKVAALALSIVVAGCAAVGETPVADPVDTRHEGPRRFALTPLTEMTPEQRAVADAIMKGPRAAVGSPAAAAGATNLSSPFNVWNRRAELAEDLKQGRVPANMKPDEQVVYDFTTELHNRHGVSDALYKRAVDAFGEQGVADLIAVNGYYVLVAMTVNVDRTPMPGGAPLPLPRLK